jgi:tetratricopeptide (TPR) repeat protein
MASNDDDGQNRGGGFGGPRPTGQLRGVQFLGQPSAQATGDQFYIKRPDGEITGPFPQSDVAQMARDGGLSGDEGVSRDRQFWMPITVVPEFALFFRAAGGGSRTMLGGLGAIVQPEAATAGDAALSGSFPAFAVDDDFGEDLFSSRAGVPASQSQSVPSVPGDPRVPAPLGNTGLGFASESSASRLASGAWSSMPDSGAFGDELSVSRAVVPDPQALSNLPGVRRLTGVNPAQDINDPTLPSLPRGFGGLPAPFEQSGELPIPAASFRGGEALPPVSASRPDPLADLPVSRGDLPPTPASNYPRPATGALPPVLGGGLPGATHNLPGFAGSAPTSANQAPGSTLTSPASRPTWGDASGMNLSGLLDLDSDREPTSQAPRGGGTQMMSAFGIDEVELPSAVDPRSRAPELPTSTRGAASILDSLGEADDLWSEQGAVGPAGVGAADSRQPQGADPFGFGDDPFASLNASESQSKNEFSGFFQASGGDASMSQAMPFPEAATAGTAAAAPQRPRMRSPGIGIAAAAVGGLAVVGLAGAALWYFVIRTPVVEPPPQVVVAAAPQVVAAEAALAELNELRRATYAETEAYAQAGRQAIAAGRNDTDRARTMVALGLMLAENPSSLELAGELTRLHSEMSDEDVSAAAALARGAWAASTTQADPTPLLEPVLREGTPLEKAYAQLFVAIYEVQQFRGVTYSEPTPEPAVAAAEGSGAAGEGSGGTGEASGASSQGSGTGAVGSAEPTPEPVAEAPVEEAVVDLVPVRVLNPEVVSSIEAAIALDSELVAARYWRGVVALELRDSATAARSFEQAVELQPQHVGALVGLTQALLAQGRLGEADGRIQRVIDELEGVSARHERSATFLVSGEVAIARIQPELAIESLLSALQVDPANVRALELLGEQFVDAGQFPRALEYFQGNDDLVRSEPAAAGGLVRAYIGLGSLNEATTAANDAAERFPTDGRFPYLLGQVAELKTEFEEAETQYRRAMQIDAGFILPSIAIANLQARSGEPATARTTLDEVMAQNLTDAAVANAVGEQYLLLGETNAAVTAFRRATDLNRAYARARTNLTDYYLASGQHARALAELQNMLDSGVDSPRVRFLHARALGEEGQYSRAIEEILALLEDDGDNSDYLFLLGRLQFLSGVASREANDGAAATRAFESAQTQFLRTLEIAPSHEQATYYLGRVEIETGAYNSAITSLTTVSDRSNRGEYHYWLGYALELGDQATQSLVEYGRAITQDPGWSLENPEVFYRRGRLLQIRGALGGAYRDLRIALTLRPRHAPASWTLGRVFFEERRWQEAIESIEHSLSIDPAQPLANYYAGRAYLSLTPPNTEAAVIHLEAALAGGLAERHPDINQRLGYVYRDTNRRPEAIAAFRNYLATPTITYEERRATENEIRRLGGQP